jgi:hypothetical protein
MEKMKYEAPAARDLSALSVRGQGPLYLCNAGLIAQGDPCTSGAVATANCGTGMFFTGPQPCTSGGTASGQECITGGSPSFTSCLSGGSAAGGTCGVGSNV